jgi:acetyl esterase/lipase
MGQDPFRDEALIYEHTLRKEGVPTKIKMYPGLPHGALDFMPMLTASKEAPEEVKAGIKWLLDQK